MIGAGGGGGALVISEGREDGGRGYTPEGDRVTGR